jgi:hypothetical protein
LRLVSISARFGGKREGGDMKRKKPIRDWVVMVRCEVTRIVTCRGCTEEQARESPFAYAVDERDLDLIDWEVQKIEPDV